MKTLHTVLKITDRSIAAISLISAWICIPVLIGVRTFDIVARQFIITPNTLFQFLEWRAFLFLVMLGFGHAYLRHAHVRIDVFTGTLPPRARAWIEIAGFFLAIVPFCAVVVWYGGEYVQKSYELGEREVIALGAPVQWVVKAFLPAGGVLVFLAGLVALARNLLFLRSGPGEGGWAESAALPSDPQSVRG